MGESSFTAPLLGSSTSELQMARHAFDARGRGGGADDKDKDEDDAAEKKLALDVIPTSSSKRNHLVGVVLRGTVDREV